MASALSTNEVTVLYNDILFRAADSGGLSFWAAALDNGTPTLAELTNIFVTSSEAQTFVDPIIRLYQAVFNRAPDAAGLAYWVGQEHAGVSFSTVVESFVGSPEFVSDYGASPNPTALINSLYLNVLGRAADSGGLSYWLGVLGTPTLASETTVMLGFVNSAEFIADTQSNIDTWLTSAANSALAGTTGSALGTPTYPATLAVPDTLTVAQANTIYTTDGDTAAVYAVSDTAANLAAAGVDAAVTHATSITATTSATVTQANTIYTTDADTTAIYAVSDTAANIITDLAGGALAAKAPLAHAISIAATGASVAQATTLVAAGFGTGTASYVLADTLANLTAATAIVAGAASYSLTNTAGLLAGITVAQAALVAGATDHASYTYSLADTAAHLAAGGSAVTDATTSITATGVTTVAQATAILALDTGHVAFTDTLADTLADLTAAGAGIVSGAAAYSLTDASGLLVNITVAEAILVAGASDKASYTYSLADSLAHLSAAPSGIVSGAASYLLIDAAGLLSGITVAEAVLLAGATDHGSYTYSLADTLANLEAASAIVSGAVSYSLTDIAGLLSGLTVAQATLVVGATDHANYTYSLADSLANLAAAPAIVTGATSYSLTDTAGLLAGITVAEATLLAGATDHANYTYSLSDTAADLAAGGSVVTDATTSITATGVTTVAQVTAILALDTSHVSFTYSLADTIADLAGAATGIVSGATSYSLTNTAGLLAGITVAEATLLAGASNHASYTYSLSDTAADLAAGGSIVTDASTSITATGVTTVAQATAILALDTSHVSFIYSLSDTLAHLAGAATGIVSGATSYSLTDTAGLLSGITVAEAALIGGATDHANYTYSLADSLANLAAAPAIVSGATSYSLTDAAGLLAGITVAEATLLAGATDHASYTYSLSDTAAHLAAGGSIVTDASTSITATGVTTVAQATAILALDTSHVSFTYALSDTLAHLAGAATGIVSGATSYSLTDTAGLLANITVAEATLIAGATDHASYTYSLSDSLANLAAAPAIVSGATAYTLTNTAGLLANVTVAEATLIAGATDHASYTYSLSDSLVHLAAAPAIVAGATSYSLTDAADTAFSDITAAAATLAVGATDFVSNAYTFTIRDTAAAVAANTSSVLNQATAIHVTATIGGNISGLTITTTSPTDLTLSADGTETLSTAEYNLFNATGITFTGSAGASNDTIVFSNAGTVTANANVGNYDLSTAGNTITLTNVADNVTGAASGDDTVNLAALAYTGTVAFGASGSDTIHVSGSSDISGATITTTGATVALVLSGAGTETLNTAEYNLFNATSITGGSFGADTLTFSNAGTVTANANVGNYDLSTAGNTITLNDVADTVTGAASGDDTVNLAALDYTGSVAFGASGSDTIQVSGSSDISGATITTTGATVALAFSSAGTETMTTEEYNLFNAAGISGGMAGTNTITFADTGTVTDNADVGNYTLADGTNSFTISNNTADDVTGSGGADTLVLAAASYTGTFSDSSGGADVLDVTNNTADISAASLSSTGTLGLIFDGSGAQDITMTVEEYNLFSAITVGSNGATAATNTVTFTDAGTVTANANVLNYDLSSAGDTITLTNVADNVTGTPSTDNDIYLGSLVYTGTLAFAPGSLDEVFATVGGDISGATMTGPSATAVLTLSADGTETLNTAEYNLFNGSGGIYFAGTSGASNDTIAFSNAGTVIDNGNVGNYTLADGTNSFTISNNTADDVTGNGGADTLVLMAASYTGTFSDSGGGTDVLDVTNNTADISTASLGSTGTLGLIFDGSGAQDITMTTEEYNLFSAITVGSNGATAATNTATFADAGTVTANANVGNYTLAAAGNTTFYAGLGTDSIAFSGANNLIVNQGGTDTLTDSGTDNTFVVPLAGQGLDTIHGNVLSNGDTFDLRAALAATTWDQQMSDLGDYLTLGTSGSNALVELSATSDGTPITIVVLVGAGSVSLSTFVSHAILT